MLCNLCRHLLAESRYLFHVGSLYFLKFAEKARGIVRVMVNGTRIPAYKNDRYLPFLR